MRSYIKFTLSFIFICFCLNGEAAKKYKWEFNSHQPEVYTTAQGQNGKQLVKAWAVAGNADKAIIQAKMDAVSAALFYGIPYDESTHGMGVANLPPMLTQSQYDEHKELIDNFFKNGLFLNYVSDINQQYPTGENNMQVPGGRKVGVNLSLDYRGLHQWLQENNIEKGVGNHFSF